MNKEIDLSKYNIRTDLAIELIKENEDIKTNKELKNNVLVTTVNISNNAGEKINKKNGLYITLEFKDITDMDNREKVETTLISELKKMMDYLNIKDNESVLIIGLGNKESTPDSLGPLTIKDVVTTNHLYELDVVSSGFRKTYTLSPGVKSSSGIETKDYIEAITNKIKPDFIIVIDALASMSIERLNKTIQISSTGISPGSGVGNNRLEISKDTIGIPVIAIGVPTVVDAATIVSDTISFLYKYYAYNMQENIKNIGKIAIQKGNYLSKNLNLNKSEKIKLFGLIGTLSDEEIYTLINEVLLPIDYNLFVSTKEIDFLVTKLAETISSSLNKSLHKAIY